MRRARRAAERVLTATVAGGLWFHLFETAPSSDWDRRNILFKAVRLANAESLRRAFYVATHPERAQPPLRSVPFALVVRLYPGSPTQSSLAVVYDAVTAAAIVVSVGLVGWWVAVRSTERVGFAAVLALVVIRLAYDPEGITYTVLAYPFCIGGLILADRVRLRDAVRDRVAGGALLGLLVFVAVMIDTEPGLIALFVATGTLVFGETTDWVTTAAAGTVGGLLTLPIDGAGDFLCYFPRFVFVVLRTDAHGVGYFVAILTQPAVLVALLLGVFLLQVTPSTLTQAAVGFLFGALLYLVIGSTYLHSAVALLHPILVGEALVRRDAVVEECIRGQRAAAAVWQRPRTSS